AAASSGWIEAYALAAVADLAAQHAGREMLVEHDPVRVAAQLGEAEPPVTGAEEQIQETLRSGPEAEPPEEAQRRGRVGHDPDRARESLDHLPLLARLARRRHDGLAVLDERRRVEAEEG